MLFHVLSRGVGRRTLFHKEEDFAAFERVMAEAHQRVPIRILAYCLLSNHWPFVLWPETGDPVQGFMRWLTHMHT
jgi:putative transposase